MEMKSESRIPAKWTPDCQGKWDYDGELVSISTRYWPRGGGFTIMRKIGADVEIEENDARQNIAPSATVSILLRVTDEAVSDVTLIEKDFEGETEGEVKHAVEQWAQEQYVRIAEVLRKEFRSLNEHV